MDASLKKLGTPVYTGESVLKLGNANAWKGGRFTNTDGYVMVYEPTHPAAQVNGYVREHRKIMGEILGRPLKASEIVHHVNGDRADNRRENLELSTFSGHRHIHGATWNGYSEDEEKIIREHYSIASQSTILSKLPGRTWDAVKQKANTMNLSRPKGPRI